METTDTEICREPGKRDGKGRRVLGRDEWYRLMADYDQSGLTQAAFCRREGVNFSTFVAWLGRRKRSGASLDEEKPAFREFALSLPSSSEHERSAPLEVLLPGGATVRGCDPAALATLIRLLRD